MATSPTVRLAATLLVGLFATLLWFPPESDGRSLVVASVAIALLFACVGRPSAAMLAGPAALLSAVVALAATSLTPLAAVRPIAMWIAAIALFFVGVAARDGALGSAWQRARSWSDGGIALALSLALYALYQKLVGFERLAASVAEMPDLADRARILERIESGRAFATMVTPAALGVVLAMAVPPLLVSLGRARGRERFVRGALLVIVLAALAATASITALAALGLVGAFIVLRRLRSVGAIAALLVAVMAIGFVAASTRDDDVFDTRAKRGPIQLRLGNFEAALAMLADDPIRGVGPGSFAEAYPAYRGGRDNETRRAHSLPLEWLAESGLLIGGLAAIAVFAFGLLPLWRVRDPEELSLAGALAILTVHNLADFTLFLPSLLWLGAALAGWLHRGGAGTALRGWPLLPVVAASLVLATSGLSDEALRRSRTEAAAGDASAAWLSAGRAVAWAPWNLDARVVRATHASEAVAVDAMLETTAEAVSAAPRRASARMASARARLIAGDPIGAFADLEAACALHPVEASYREARDSLATRLGLE